MAVKPQVSASASAARTDTSTSFSKGLPVVVVALVTILLLPQPEGLSVARPRMLAIFSFAVVIWISDALDYAVSAIVITALMGVLLGLSPDLAKPDRVLCTCGRLLETNFYRMQK